jgi:hypothetical protein
MLAFCCAIGYLSMRFLYSSSKVQIGTVVLHNYSFVVFSKVLVLFMMDYNSFSYSFLLMVLRFEALYPSKEEKNELDYNL